MTYLVVMVAGMSSRFGGKPKQMAKVGPNGETLIEYSINQAIKNPFSKIIFITNILTEKLFIDIFKNKYNNIPVDYIQQKYDKDKRIRPWGTADAVSSLYPYFLNKNDNVKNLILINGDDIYGENTFLEGYTLLNDFSNNNSIIGGLLVKDTMPDSGTVNRGIISIDNNFVINIEEKLNISIDNNPELMNQLANVNFIGLQFEDLKNLNTINEIFKQKNKSDKKIESNLTTHLSTLIKNNLTKIKYFFIRDKILGLTNPDDENILKNILSITTK
tara:strand:- start:167 stop:988 length:822 start_codon:yes stop_codon:yes gene_type:complete